MKIRGILGMEIYRLFSSFRFWISIIGLVFMCLIVTRNDIDKIGTTVNVFGLLTYLSQFKILIILFAAVPFAMSFCQEWNSGYIKMITSRKGIKRYTSSVYFTSCLSAYLTVFVGLITYIIIISTNMTLYDADLDISYTHSVYGELLCRGQIWQYFICRIHLISMEAMLCVSAGVMFSAVLTDSFVAIAFPFIWRYMFEELTYRLPSPFNLASIANANTLWNKGIVFNISYVIVLFTSMLCVEYFIFQNWVYRRMENELC